MHALLTERFLLSFTIVFALAALVTNSFLGIAFAIIPLIGTELVIADELQRRAAKQLRD